MQLHALEQLFKFSVHLSIKISLPADQHFPGKIADKYMENLKQVSAEI